jgi:excisionase family DNA binding protein
MLPRIEIQDSSQQREQKPLLISIDDCAIALGVAKQTIRNWLSTGKVQLPTVKVGGRRLVRTSDLLAWVDSLAPSHPTAAPATDATPQPVPAPAPRQRRRGRPRKAASGKEGGAK